ncbi:MAG: hypothetical protein LBR28_06890 [Bacteroidales bacterium]|jgi:hypothetical protein|nr:hypothetical protein [Bacteroidales bacterium]
MIRIKEQKTLVALVFTVMVFSAKSAFAQNSIQSEVTQQQDIQYTQKVITEDPQIQATIKWVTYRGTLSKYSAKIICQ